MRYWVHATITIVFSVVMLIGAAALLVGLAIWMPAGTPDWLMRVVFVAVPLIALFLPSIIMTRVPCVCPKCGGKAKYGFAAFGNYFMPKYAWWCCSGGSRGKGCGWSTYEWSAYQQRRTTRRM